MPESAAERDPASWPKGGKRSL